MATHADIWLKKQERQKKKQEIENDKEEIKVKIRLMQELEDPGTGTIRARKTESAYLNLFGNVEKRPVCEPPDSVSGTKYIPIPVEYYRYQSDLSHEALLQKI